MQFESLQNSPHTTFSSLNCSDNLSTKISQLSLGIKIRNWMIGNVDDDHFTTRFHMFDVLRWCNIQMMPIIQFNKSFCKSHLEIPMWNVNLKSVTIFGEHKPWLFYILDLDNLNSYLTNFQKQASGFLHIFTEIPLIPI